VIDTSGIYAPFAAAPRNYYVYVYNPVAYKMNEKKYKEGLWKLYWAPYGKIMSSAPSKYKRESILAVSEFTKDRIKAHWGLDSQVLYPPLAIDDFVNHGYENRRGVITIGRFTPEKRHEWQLEIARDSQTVISGYVVQLKHHQTRLFLKIYEKDLRRWVSEM